MSLRVLFVVSGLAGHIFVTSCSINTHDFDAPVMVSERFSLSGEAQMPSLWWINLQDPVLNGLVDKALSDNFDIKVAYYRVKQSYAIARKAGSELIPAVNGSAGLERITQYQEGIGQSRSEIFSIGVAASYELDLWGRIRANTLAAELDGASAVLAMQTAKITVSAQIASVWYQLVEQQLQLRLLNRQIEINEQYVELVTVRFEGGQATAADLFQQRQVLDSALGDRFKVLAQIQVLKNQIAVLTGEAPGKLDFNGHYEFPKLPVLPSTGLTADLLKRRPDIQQSYLALQAADVRIAAAVADRLPRISLSASIDTKAPDLQDFFNNWMATLAGNLVIPIIDGGRRVAEVERTEAVSAESLNEYGKKIVTAIEEVENSLVQESRQHERLDSLKKQLHSLDEANKQIRQRYLYGTIDFLRVLTSLTNLQSLERSFIQAELELIKYRIDLYRALAGGWDSLPIDSESDKENG
jgi:NodT family efflux transporter outer membrane factor (OMF) lipoprotein